MSVYVDDPLPIGGRYDNFCHLWADSDAELHAIALCLHLPRTWLQISRGRFGDFKAYDVSPSKRALALRYGAEYMPLREWIRRQNGSGGA